ncbi:MAG: peptidylprolyl isomerase [Microbacterium sp.]
MIQGGDPLGQGVGGPATTFDDEISPELNFNEPYILAMANAASAATPPARPRARTARSSSSRPTRPRTGKHTIFGAVADDASKAVAGEIAAVRTGAATVPSSLSSSARSTSRRPDARHRAP